MRTAVWKIGRADAGYKKDKRRGIIGGQLSLLLYHALARACDDVPGNPGKPLGKVGPSFWTGRGSKAHAHRGSGMMGG